MKPIAILTVAFALAISLGSAACADDRPLTYKERGDAFLAHIEKTGVDAEVLAELRTKWEQLLGEDSPQVDFIADSLFQVDERFRDAYARFEQDFPREAADRLSAILESNPDDYARAVATFWRGKILFQQKNYENARPLLEKAAREMASRHQSDGEALYLLGACQAGLVERELAVKTLDEFLERFPEAAERFRVDAEKLRGLLIERGENVLLDLADRMEIVTGLLDKIRTGEPTQKKQDEIVDILDELIKKHEQECKNCSGKGSGGGQGRGQGQGGGQGGAQGVNPSDPASGMRLPVGSADDPKIPDDGSAAGAGDGWNKLREKERADILDRIGRGVFPERYKALLEQFHTND